MSGNGPKPSRRIVVDDTLDLVVMEPKLAAELFAVIDGNRADLRRWLTWVDGTLTEADLRRYARFAHEQFVQRSSFEYVVRLGEAPAGAIGLHNVDVQNQSAHIGYWLAPECRGRGRLTMAARALTDYAIHELGFHRLEIRVVVENAPSRAVAERLGYELEGILRQSYLLHGEFRDLVVYAMTAERWAQGNPPASARHGGTAS